MTNLHVVNSGQAPSNGVKKARIDGIGQWMCTIHTITYNQLISMNHIFIYVYNPLLQLYLHTIQVMICS